MTPPADPLTDAEQLSAYLAGDLDSDEAAALEQRLHAEPALVAVLDDLAAALIDLRDADRVQPPDGYSERLHRRLESEGGGAARVVALRPARTSLWSRLAPLGKVAAALVAVAFVGAGLVTALGDRSNIGAGMAGSDSAGGGEQSAEGEVEAQTERQPQGTDEAADEGGAVDGRETFARGRRVELADAEAVRRRYRRVPDPAELRAGSARQLLDDAPGLEGVDPNACARAVAPDDRPGVILRVEAVRFAGRRALAVVVDGPAGRRVDLVEPTRRACRVRRSIDL